MTIDEVHVLGLLLEDDERGDDAQAGLDHRRELAREDLERLGLDALDLDAVLGGVVVTLDLVEALGQKAPQTELLPRGAQVGRLDLAVQERALRVDGAIGERRHYDSPYRQASKAT